MALISSKVKYLFSSTRKQLTRQGQVCPSCGGTQSSTVSRKYVVTALHQCHSCNLLFRIPTTSATENQTFYQKEYSQGLTTDTPSITELETLKQSKFKDSTKNYSRYLKVLAAMGGKPGDQLFEYGCSWGYGSWQFMQAGYKVSAFEISVPRCEYAKTNLGIDAQFTLDIPSKSCDIFFSSHVLEHVPKIADTLALARTVLKPGGLFVAFTPNGSDAFRLKQPRSWDAHWGSVHPNFLNDQFYQKAFQSDTYLLASSPYDLAAIQAWRSAPNVSTHLDLSGDELLVIAQFNPA